MEELYSHYAHPKTAILMGHAKCVILQKCAEAAIKVRSFSATQIKKSVTGNSGASKEQIQKTVQVNLSLSQPHEPNDAADAIAAAMCCANSFGKNGNSSRPDCRTGRREELYSFHFQR